MESADTIDIPAARVSQGERLNRMLVLLEERAFWSVAELAARFDVSEETIRRDVRQLEQSGRVQKTHGGVRLPSGTIEAPYRIRLREQAEAKQRIGREAARLVTPGMTLLLDSGTTSFWLARALAPMRDLSIITNSIEIAHEVLGRPGQQLFFAGGRINSDYHAAFGTDAVAYARCFVPDLTILSIGAVEADRGFLDFDADEAMFKHALLERARSVVVLADATKFEKTGSLQVAGFDQIDELVTDRAPPIPIARAAAAAGTTIRVVGED